jgi:diaminopimelate decarboxylase
MLNSSFHYHDEQLYCDGVALADIAREIGTPTYVYSLKRATENYQRIARAFQPAKAHIHYSAKANGNLSILRALIQRGAGVDCVSGGEIYRALLAGAAPENIVFAGVGKTVADLRYGVEQHVGWINIENADECLILNALGNEFGRNVRVALRFNPDVAANTHRHIATGHGGAKFGLAAEAIRSILDGASHYPHLSFEGIHIHIGSQLGDTSATEQALQTTLELIAPYPAIRTLDIGGGLPVAYKDEGVQLPTPQDFADRLIPLTKGYDLILEPGRSIIADAGALLAQVLYLKEHGGQKLVILDTGMTEIIRPMLYEAHHTILPLKQLTTPPEMVDIVGPVCETTDRLAQSVALPTVQPSDFVAILTAGAYGMVMASNYNARPRPAEIVVNQDGDTWRIARARETWADLVRGED